MRNQTKEVYFDKCKSCVHYKTPEDENPCDECLQVFNRPDSHTPMYHEPTNNTNIKEETK